MPGQRSSRIYPYINYNSARVIPTSSTASTDSVAAEAAARAAADTTLQNNINLKANIASPTFTGDPRAPTPTAGDNDTSVATTAFVTSAVASAAGITQLTGNVTAGPGSGSQVATIANGAVTYAKIQNVTAARLLGNPTGSVAAPSEISLGTGLAFAGTVLNGSTGTLTGVTAGTGITVSGAAPSPTVGLTVPVTVANGGTNKTSWAMGSVVFAGSTTALQEDNANLFWDDTGNNMGVGTNAPEHKLHVGNKTGKITVVSWGGATAAGDGSYFAVFNGATALMSIGNYSAIFGGTYNAVGTIWSNANLALMPGNNVGIGTTTPVSKVQIAMSDPAANLRDGWNGAIEIQATAANVFSSFAFTGQATDRYSAINWSSSTSGFPAVVNHIGAQIQGVWDAATSASLRFFTNAAINTADPIERLTILGGGNVGIGATVPAYKLDVNGVSNTAGLRIAIQNIGGFTRAQLQTLYNLDNTGASAFGWNYTNGGGELDLFISPDGGGVGGLKIWHFPNTTGNPTNIFTVTAGGNVGIGGVTGPIDTVEVNGGVAAIGHRARSGTAGTYSGSYFNINWTGSVSQLWIDAVNQGTITVTCDYRIKENVAPLASTWNKIKSLRPISYTLADHEELGRMADPDERWGFIAHELQETLLPTAATGYKDAPNLIQSPDLMAIIASLTKALQEAMGRIEQLEARL